VDFVDSLLGGVRVVSAGERTTTGMVNRCSFRTIETTTVPGYRN